ncbi:hypothetical protein MY11210_003822 [Beauveria gryllotalpidicola]
MQLGLVQSAVLLLFGSLILLVEARSSDCHVRRFPLPGCTRYDNRNKPNVRCWTQANNMESLIDCVSSRVSNTWCPYFTHNEGGRLISELDQLPGSCLSARMVLQQGFRDNSCPMRVVGSMNACRYDAPSYRGCLCDLMKEWRLERLRWCFGGPVLPVNCPRRLAKRSSPVVRREVDLRSPLLKDYDEYEDQDVYFYIDDYGRPFFTNAAGIDLPGQDVGSIYPLPSYDQLYQYPLDDRQAVRRCYFFPYTAHVWCTQWLLGADDDHEKLYPDATGLPQGASVKSSTGVTTSFARTLTKAPGNTTPSPASVTVSHTLTGTPVDAAKQTGTETPTPTETGTGTGTSHSGDAKSAASSAVAPLLAALGVLALVI